MTREVLNSFTMGIRTHTKTRLFVQNELGSHKALVSMQYKVVASMHGTILLVWMISTQKVVSTLTQPVGMGEHKIMSTLCIHYRLSQPCMLEHNIRFTLSIHYTDYLN